MPAGVLMLFSGRPVFIGTASYGPQILDIGWQHYLRWSACNSLMRTDRGWQKVGFEASLHRIRFPLEGGTGAIWKAVARLLPWEKQVSILQSYQHHKLCIWSMLCAVKMINAKLCLPTDM